MQWVAMSVIDPPSIINMEHAFIRNAVDVRLDCGVRYGVYLFTPLTIEYEEGAHVRIWIGSATRLGAILKYTAAEFSQNERNGVHELMVLNK